jgi:sodium/pantothenate symporter
MPLETSSSVRTIIIIVFSLYSLILVGISFYAKRQMNKSTVDHYVEEFYTGGRGMGSLVIALMIAAGLCSAGTFLGGPGLGFSVGLAWVLVGFSQVFMNFSVLGQIGKKIGIVGRRIKAQSYLDLFVSRYNHNIVIGIVGVLAIICFMGSYTVSQFVGGARLFESMTGQSYFLGLVLFAGVVLIVTALGGIKGVAIAIVFQGIVMTVAVLSLFFGSLAYIGPIENAYKTLISINPALVTPWAWTPMYTLSMWVVFGLLSIGLPHGVVATLTYKSTKALHSAIILGGCFVLLWTFVLIWVGSISRVVFPDLKVADQIIPTMAMKVLPPWLAGLTLAGVAGAIQSTVGAMVIVISGTFVKDAYQSYINPKASNQTLRKVTIMSTGIICVLIFLASIKPPQALEWLIVFAIGGLGSAFFWPLILGIYWKRANEHGGAAGMVGGLVTYILAAGKYLPITMGMNAIVVSLLVSGVLTIGVSLCTPKSPKGIIQIWFGKTYPKAIPNK